jgi:hypothetical protein
MTITAKFDGECDVCGQTITAGIHRIIYDERDDTWVHVGCCQKAELQQRIEDERWQLLLASSRKACLRLQDLLSNEEIRFWIETEAQTHGAFMALDNYDQTLKMLEETLGEFE